MPIVVIGSGPSRDVSVKKLVKEREKLIVFAADSVLPSLHAHGIAPDATFSIDAEKSASKCIPQGLGPRFGFPGIQKVRTTDKKTVLIAYSSPETT